MAILSKDEPPAPFTLEWVLGFISRFYERCVRVRIWLYQKKILPQKELPCFVISVGNIVAGGSGKTPMTIYISALLNRIGKKPVVISRGYKGDYRSDVLVVSDGRQVLADAGQSGDEPFMMASEGLFPVVVGKDRFKAGKKALSVLTPRPDAVVLDDGFQHLKLKRDLNILLFDFKKPLGNNRFLPAGRLRERPQTASKRADALIFTRCPEKRGTTGPMDEILRLFPGLPFFKTSHKPFIRHWIGRDGLETKDQPGIAAIKGKNAVVFSGLADNPAFFRSMADLGVNMNQCLEFKDHHRYKTSDFDRIDEMARQTKADLILTTHKDWVRVGRKTGWPLDLVVVDVRIEFEDKQGFEALLILKIKTWENR